MEQTVASGSTTTIDIPDDVNTSEERHLIPKVSLSKYEFNDKIFPHIFQLTYKLKFFSLDSSNC